MRFKALCVFSLLAAVPWADAQLGWRTWHDYGGGPDNSHYLTLDPINKSDPAQAAWLVRRTVKP